MNAAVIGGLSGLDCMLSPFSHVLLLIHECLVLEPRANAAGCRIENTAVHKCWRAAVLRGVCGRDWMCDRWAPWCSTSYTMMRAVREMPVLATLVRGSTTLLLLTNTALSIMSTGWGVCVALSGAQGIARGFPCAPLLKLLPLDQACVILTCTAVRFSHSRL